MPEHGSGLPSILTSRQIGAISRVNILQGHVRLKVRLTGRSARMEFPPEPDVWLSIRQVDANVQAAVRRFITANRRTGRVTISE